MFTKVMTPVPLTRAQLQLPRSQAVTSYYLPKVAEQGLGIPVRRIDGDYQAALQKRLDAVLQHGSSAHKPVTPKMAATLQPVVFTRDAKVKQLAALWGGVVASDYGADQPTANMLNSLLVMKDDEDLETIGLDRTEPYGAYLDTPDLLYLGLLFALEDKGVIRGVIHQYDVSQATISFPQHYDVRTIVIDAKPFNNVEQLLGMRQSEILKYLDTGRRIDQDAGPLLDFFHLGFKQTSRHAVRSLSVHWGVSYEPFVAGRSHAVGIMTVVKAI